MQAGKWYQIGNPFVGLGNDDLVTLNTMLTDGFSSGDQVFVYDSTNTRYNPARQWIAPSDGASGWYNMGDGAYDTHPLKSGQAVFVHKISSGTVTLKGRVSVDEVAEFESGQWSQIVCVYPANQSLNEMKWTGISVGDQAFIYDSETGGYRPLRQWVDNGSQSGWYNLGTGAYDTEKLPIGQAIFINKVSMGKGTCQPDITR